MKISINRQDAKIAKNFAKQNSFQEGKDLRFSSTAQPSRNQIVIGLEYGL